MARTAAAAAPSCREGEAGVQVQQLAAAGGGGGEGGGADRQSAADCRHDRSRESATCVLPSVNCDTQIDSKFTGG